MVRVVMMTDPAPTDLTAYVRGEVRARLAREGLTFGSFADRIDRSRDWTTRRLTQASGAVGVTLEDLQVIADGLGVTPRDLLP